MLIMKITVNAFVMVLIEKVIKIQWFHSLDRISSQEINRI